MRSLNLFLATLPFQLIHAAKEVDTTVVVTTTRTVTFCPVTQVNFCETDGVFDPITNWPVYPTNATRSWGDWGTGGSSATLSSGVGSGSGTGLPTVTSGVGSSTSISNGGGNGTTATATSSSACASSTFEALVDSKCNTPSTRGKWCHGKSVDSDTHERYFSGDTKHFSLVITNTTLDFDGVQKPTFAINGQSPGPAIEVNWGDKVVIEVTNLLENNATTIHWHGIHQYGTNDQDGVPGVSECGIAPGYSRTYSWHASTYGTGWYHSHLLAQFGGGIRGPIIIHGPATANYDHDLGSVMIDDMFEGTIFQAGYGAARVGAPNTTNYLLNGKNVSPDLSRGEHQKWTFKQGKKHLFRIINSSAQNAYVVRIDGHKLKVIAADFIPIVPYETEWLYVSNGQRYDVVVEANQPLSSYFFRAVTQTGCPSLNFNNGLGPANGIVEYDGACGVFPTTNLGNGTLPVFNSCLDEPLSKLVPHVKKTAGTLADFTASVRNLAGGNAAPVAFGASGRIVRWFMNGNATMNVTYTQPTLKSLATIPDVSSSSLLSNAIRLNTTSDSEWVYFVIQNNFRAGHPMHLHGHDFSVLGAGPGIFNSSMVSTLNFNNPIRRDTTMLFGTPAAPSGYTVIGFQTDNPGAWLMHCHIIWHSDGGMALQFIERAEEINAGKYWNTPAFQDECRAMSEYEAEGPHRQKPEYEAGMKKRMDEHKRAIEAVRH